MTLSELADIGSLIGSFAVMASLIYFAVELRHLTNQQKREETVSIQHGQNSVIANMLDPRIVRAYAMAAEGDGKASAEDRAVAIVWVIQYLNHFQIVCDLYDQGVLPDERFELWSNFAVSMVASRGIRDWWEREQGRMAFMPRVRNLIEERLDETDPRPLAFNEMWEVFGAQTWKSEEASQA